MPESFESIQEIARAGESASVEFKAGLADARKLAETAAGMATIGGGVILLGISDDGRPKGTVIGKGEIERSSAGVTTASTRVGLPSFSRTDAKRALIRGG